MAFYCQRAPIYIRPINSFSCPLAPSVLYITHLVGMSGTGHQLLFCLKTQQFYGKYIHDVFLVMFFSVCAFKKSKNTFFHWLPGAWSQSHSRVLNCLTRFLIISKNCSWLSFGSSSLSMSMLEKCLCVTLINTWKCYKPSRQMKKTD